jgi:hypothetical protein
VKKTKNAKTSEDLADEMFECALGLLRQATLIDRAENYKICDFFEKLGFCRVCLTRKGMSYIKGGDKTDVHFLCDDCAKALNKNNSQKWERGEL